MSGFANDVQVTQEAQPRAKRSGSNWISIGLVVAMVFTLVVVITITVFNNKPEIAVAPVAIESTIETVEPLPEVEESLPSEVIDEAVTSNLPDDLVQDFVKKNADGSLTYNVPVVGDCPVDRDGVIGAPSNFRDACEYSFNESIVYTAHAVRGDSVGAFEHIRFLSVGQIIHFNNQTWKVSEVNTFPADDLPGRLFEDGSVMLLTCHLDEKVEAGAEYEDSDIAILERV